MLSLRSRHLAPVTRGALSLAIFTVACGGGGDSPSGSGSTPTTPTPTSTLTTIVMADSVVMDTWGDTASLSAEGRDQSGKVMAGLAPTWSSSDTTIALVNGSGLITGVRAGVATITARVNNVQATSRAVVKLQRNASCKLPATPAARGVARGPVTFIKESAQRFPPHLMEYSGNDVAVIDYDRDGKQDVVLFNSIFAGPPGPAGRMFVFRNAGSTFTDATAQAIGANPPTPGFSYRPIVADYNGDGRPDLYVGQGGYDDQPFPGARNFLFMNTGSGFSEVGATQLNPSPIGLTHGAAAGDFDCDGDIDLIETDVRTPTRPPGTRLYINDGAANFTDRAAQQLPASIIPTSNSAFLSFAACDIDRDGDTDLIGGGWFVDQRRPDMILLNNGFGKFRVAPATLPAPAFGNNTYVIDVNCADFDGDGYNDLALAASDKYAVGRTVLWRNNGDMTFRDLTVPVTDEWPANRFPERVVVRDFNDDGWPDVLSTGWGDPWNGFWTTGTGGNAIYFNNGSAGGFTRRTLENWFGIVWPIDVNADGKLDLLWAGGMRSGTTPNQQIYIQP